MKTNISVIAETTRPLSTGEFPLAIRLHKGNRRRYVRLGISLTPKYWDEKRGKIKSNCPNLDYYNNIVSKKIDLFQKQVWEFQNSNRPYTLDQLIESVEQPITKTTIEGYLKNIVVELKSTNHIGNAGHYEVLLNSLLKYSNGKKLRFTDIDTKFRKGYEDYLDSIGNKSNTKYTRFKTLKATYNRAIKDKIVKKEYSPFIEYNVGKLQEKTAKRAISKKDIVRIINFDVNKLIKKPWSSMQLAKDIFLFSYFGCGINLIDIAFLEKDNRIGSRIVYKRSKTDKVINFQVHPSALEILEKYDNPQRKFRFPILDNNVHYSSEQQYRRIKKVT